MSVKINSHGLHNPVPVQYTDPAALVGLGQGNWAASQMQRGDVTALVVPVISGLGGVLGVGYGGYLTKKGIEEVAQAKQCGDTNGAISGSFNTGIGVTFVGMSAASTANGIMGILPVFEITSNLFEPLTKIFTTAMNWLGVALYSFYIGGAAAALPELNEFRGCFDEMLNNPRMCPKTKALEALRFLQNQISLTDAEQAELSQMPPDSVPKKLQMKWDRLVRCVGLECAQKIYQDLPEIFREVKAGKLENAEKLITQVSRSNFKQKVTQYSLLAAGIIGVVGSVLTLLSIGGYAGFALFAGASMLYWLNGMIGDIAYQILPPRSNIREMCYNPVNASI